MAFQMNFNMGHTSAPSAAGPGGFVSKKRSFDDVEPSSFESGEYYQNRPKLSLPRSAGLVFNGEAQFHPLPADINQALLAQMGHNPFAGGVSSNFVTPSLSSSSSSSSFGHGHKSSNGSDYFSSSSNGSCSTAHYPEVEPYPSTTSSFGILGPTTTATSSSSDDDDEGMELDGSSGTGKRSGHGAWCKSIPQLCVRYNDGMGSELWASCSDCGACSRVESNQPASNLCYSP